jgi:hypothetical protein
LPGLKESGVFDHIRRAEVEALDVKAFTRLTEDIGQGPKFIVDFFVEAYRLIRPESFLAVPVSGTPALISGLPGNLIAGPAQPL